MYTKTNEKNTLQKKLQSEVFSWSANHSILL